MAVYCHGKWTVCMIKEGKRERWPIPLLSLKLVIYDRVLQIAQSFMDFHFVWSFSNVLDSIIYITFNSQIATLIPHCTEYTHFHSLKICEPKCFIHILFDLGLFRFFSFKYEIYDFDTWSFVFISIMSKICVEIALNLHCLMLQIRKIFKKVIQHTSTHLTFSLTQ